MKSNKIQYSKGFFTVNGEVRTETKAQIDYNEFMDAEYWKDVENEYKLKSA